MHFLLQRYWRQISSYNKNRSQKEIFIKRCRFWQKRATIKIHSEEESTQSTLGRYEAVFRISGKWFETSYIFCHGENQLSYKNIILPHRPLNELILMSISTSKIIIKMTDQFEQAVFAEIYCLFHCLKWCRFSPLYALSTCCWGLIWHS